MQDVFQPHEYIVHAGSGVCYIDDICTMQFQGLGKKTYYKLVPLYENGSTIYTPVEQTQSIIRKIASSQDVMALLSNADAIECVENVEDKAREEAYKALLKEKTCRAWLSIIRSAYMHNQQRAEEGKKPTQMDERYMGVAENLLHGELAVALEIDRDQVVDFIVDHLQRQNIEYPTSSAQAE